MRALRFAPTAGGLPGLLIVAAAVGGALTPVLVAPMSVAQDAVTQDAAADDVQAQLHKANLYIEVAKYTERAVESWERYGSWVNIKTGPTGKERYISYGLYDLPDLSGQLKEARAATARAPAVAKLDAAMPRYIDAYEALAPVINEASAYYEQAVYQSDGAAQGRTLHTRLVPLVTAFLAEREAMLPHLRAFVRDTEQQELAATQAKEGQTAGWQARRVMHAANRIIDLFPRDRPQPLHSDTIDDMIKGLGPDTPGEKFDEIIAGVAAPQTKSVIDVARYGPALKNYAEAITALQGFAGEKPDDFDEFTAASRRRRWRRARAASSTAPARWSARSSRSISPCSTPWAAAGCGICLRVGLRQVNPH